MAKSKFKIPPKEEEEIGTFPVEETVQPVIYPLLRAFSTFQGTIDGTQFRVFPRYVTGNQTLPQGGFGKVWTFAEVYQNGEKQQGENFTNLTDIQVKELRRVGMIQ